MRPKTFLGSLTLGVEFSRLGGACYFESSPKFKKIMIHQVNLVLVHGSGCTQQQRLRQNSTKFCLLVQVNFGETADVSFI